MLVLLDIITDVFFRPAQGMRKAAKVEWKKAVLFFFLTFFFVQWPIARTLLPEFDFSLLFVLIFLSFFLSFLFLFFYSLLIHGLVNFLFAVSGDLKELIAAFSFTYLPFTLLAPLLLLPLFQQGVIVNIVLLSGLFFWTSFLATFTVKAVYGISYWKANTVTYLPTALVCLTFIVLFVYLAAWAGSFFSQLSL